MLQPIFKIKTDIEDGSYNRFIIEPLIKGYGYTLGNALRRVLLSSLEGTAVTHVEINNISHPFTTIDGMKENVIELLLNVKKIRIKATVDEAKSIYLDVKGAKKVTGADLQPEAGLEVVNKDLILCHLTDKKAHLKMKLTVNRGYRYVLAEELDRPHLGVIPVDAVFSPVIKANYKVEATRVGRETDWDKLILDITTDGTITPLEALEKAALILTDQFRHIIEPNNEDKTDEATDSQEGVKTEGQDDQSLSLDELSLSPRVINALKKADIYTLSDLAKLSLKELKSIKNLGKKSVGEIISILAENKIKLD